MINKDREKEWRPCLYNHTINKPINPYHTEEYSWLVPNYAKCDYSHDWSKCSTMPSATIVA